MSYHWFWFPTFWEFLIAFDCRFHTRDRRRRACSCTWSRSTGKSEGNKEILIGLHSRLDIQASCIRYMWTSAGAPSIFLEINSHELCIVFHPGKMCLRQPADTSCRASISPRRSPKSPACRLSFRARARCRKVYRVSESPSAPPDRSCCDFSWAPRGDPEWQPPSCTCRFTTVYKASARLLCPPLVAIVFRSKRFVSWNIYELFAFDGTTWMSFINFLTRLMMSLQKAFDSLKTTNFHNQQSTWQKPKALSRWNESALASESQTRCNSISK